MGMFDSETEKLDLDPRVDENESGFALQNFFHRFMYPLIAVGLIALAVSGYLGYVYVTVMQINRHNTSLLRKYMKERNLAIFSDTDYRYTSLCYSTELIDLIQALHKNPENINDSSKYRILRLLKSSNTELEKAYKNLNINEKKSVIEQIYVKIGMNITPTIAKEIHTNQRIILSEIGAERPVNNKWETSHD